MIKKIALLLSALAALFIGSQLIIHAPDNGIALDGLLVCGVGFILVLISFASLGEG